MFELFISVCGLGETKDSWKNRGCSMITLERANSVILKRYTNVDLKTCQDPRLHMKIIC